MCAIAEHWAKSVQKYKKTKLSILTMQSITRLANVFLYMCSSRLPLCKGEAFTWIESMLLSARDAWVFLAFGLSVPGMGSKGSTSCLPLFPMLKPNWVESPSRSPLLCHRAMEALQRMSWWACWVPGVQAQSLSKEDPRELRHWMCTSACCPSLYCKDDGVREGSLIPGISF